MEEMKQQTVMSFCLVNVVCGGEGGFEVKNSRVDKDPSHEAHRSPAREICTYIYVYI